MPDIETLNHTTWDCKYHVVFIPQYRRKALYHELRRHLGEVFRALAAQKECRIEEGHLMADHVHMLLSIPPKYSVAQVWVVLEPAVLGFEAKGPLFLSETTRSFVGVYSFISLAC